MAEKIYPSSKPAGGAAASAVNGAAATSAHVFPPTKPQKYGGTRPYYRPQAPPRRRCCTRCCCFLWCLIVLLFLIFIIVATGGVFWLLYRPQRPSFTVDSLRVSQFNLTSPSLTLRSRLNLTISTRNPNGKISFYVDPISVLVSSNGVLICNGSFPGIKHGPKNVTTLRSEMSSVQELDSSSERSIESDLKKKNGFPLVVELETRVRVKVGKIRTKKVGTRVVCDGIRATVPSGKTATARPASTSDARCKVDVRIKIWKWYL